MATFRGTNVPDFLVIGAMKCATTTLHQDLVKHPSICCGEKELNALTAVELQPAMQKYQRNFRNAESHQLLGDVSTHYSMRQEYPHVADHAKLALGPELKLIYLVREPISRALSHHQHMMNVADSSGMGPDVNLEIRKSPLPIDYSCYASQLEPWLEHYDLSHFHVVKFEDYVSDRQNTLRGVFNFLGVEAIEIEIEPEGANRGNNRMASGKLTSKIMATKIFQRIIKPCLPVFIMPFIRRVFLKKAELSTITPTEDTIGLIFDGVKEDARKLQELLNLDAPLWDLESVKLKYISSNSNNERK